MNTRTDHTFFVRKLHSLMGVIPVGVFLLFHLYVNSFSNAGPEAYNGFIAGMRKLPALFWVELLLIYLPILFHALYGFIVVAQAKNNVGTYSYARNWYFYLQRVTGVITFVFIGYHVLTIRFGEYFGLMEASFEAMSASLANPVVFAFYILGVVAAVFHLANGLWLFGVNWGILVSPRAQRVATQVLAVFFLAVSALGINALLPFVR